MVDVVVRDHAGAPVLGLTQSDFDVFEDGVPQRIISFEAVSAESDAASTSRARDDRPADETASPTGANAQSVVAVVFHQLSHQSRVMAVNAARSLTASLPNDDFAGIFVVDLTLTTFAPFTRNRRELERALDAVVRRPPVHGDSSGGGGVAETAGPPGQHSPRSGAAQAAEIRGRLDAGLEIPQQEAAQASSLTDLIAFLARFPGRKSIILFSEGLAVSPRLERVVDRARAENVTVYSVGARGLSVGGRIALPNRKVDRSELTGSSRVQRSASSRAFPEADQTSGLRPLAEYTGGFLISDTNDLTTAVKSIRADRRAFYLIAYASSNETLDNSVRQIEVRVRRPNVSVRARTGYVAAKPDTLARANYEYETPALKALDAVPRPRDFEFKARAYVTPKPGQPYLVSVVAEIPAQMLEFRVDARRKRYSGQVAVLTRVSDTSKVVATQSQLYNLTGDESRLNDFRSRAISYLRTLTLSPGSYTFEAAVYDGLSNRTSTREWVVNVPDVDKLPVVAGDLIVVSRLDKPKGNQRKVNPFAWRRIVLSPHLAETTQVRPPQRLVLAIPLVVTARAVTATLALITAGRPIAEVPLALGEPDKDGRLIGIIDLPFMNLPAGQYEVRLTLKAGGHSIERSATVQVVA